LNGFPVIPFGQKHIGFPPSISHIAFTPHGFGSQGLVGPKRKRFKLNCILYKQTDTASDASITKLNNEYFLLEQKLLTHSIPDIKNTSILKAKQNRILYTELIIPGEESEATC
jgi:hypothetical protein